MLSSDAVVIRDGQETKIPGKEVVPGDIVEIESLAMFAMLEVNNLAS
jgi:magnesium-transporting ATPase (P-type)